MLSSFSAQASSSATRLPNDVSRYLISGEIGTAIPMSAANSKMGVFQLPVPRLSSGTITTGNSKPLDLWTVITVTTSASSSTSDASASLASSMAARSIMSMKSLIDVADREASLAISANLWTLPMALSPSAVMARYGSNWVASSTA